MKNHTFTFMGTGAGCGVPHFSATARVRRGQGESAREARRLRDHDQGREDAIHRHAPDLRHQCIRENVRRIDEVLYTHCHSDHVGGLLELEYLVQLKQKEALPVYGSAETLAGIAQEFHYMTYASTCTRLPDRHRRVRRREVHGAPLHPRRGHLWISHRDRRHAHVLRLRHRGSCRPRPMSDCRISTSSRWTRRSGRNNWSPAAHHSVQECIDEGLSLNAGKIYLTHLCMHYDEPITLVELEEFLTQYEGRVEAAHDGLTFEI